MAKYHYDKKALKGIGVGPFLGEVKERNKHIEAADTTPPKSWYNPNELAKRLHPEEQYCLISKVVDHGDAKSFTLVPDTEKGTTEMAFFRAGQYVSVSLDLDGALVHKPYTICSNPKDALGKENTSYTLTIKKTNPAYASAYILENWKEGTAVTLSGPQGDFYYQNLRDAKKVIALAGGSGITPFFSMASAIVDGLEDFSLTILYGSRTADSILLKDELDKLAASSNGKVQVVHVLSHEEKEGFEHGFLTAELIQKYAAGEEFSLFLCGPKAMYAFAAEQVKTLHLPKRLVRMELAGDNWKVEELPGFPMEKKDQEFTLTVDIRGEKISVPCKANETLLWAMEKAGIAAPSHCRSGECGWCHSLMLCGDVYIPEDADGRRIADKKFGWIHPCCSYPLTDIELCVYPKL